MRSQTAIKTTSYTVKQLAALAGVSVRTLHYYDEIGLLRPEAYGENGYRYYGGQDLLRLQQILFFRELDFSLEEIRDLLERPDFDLLRALQVHRKTLAGRVERLEQLIHTIDKTVRHLEGETEMSDKEYYEGFSEEKQKEYEQYARENWDASLVDQSVQRWGSYSAAQKKAVIASGGKITFAIADNMEKGYRSPEIQALIKQHHQHMNNFYDCSLEIYAGLGHLYNTHEGFMAFYEKIRPGLAAFMEQAITYYAEQSRS